MFLIKGLGSIIKLDLEVRLQIYGKTHQNTECPYLESVFVLSVLTYCVRFL